MDFRDPIIQIPPQIIRQPELGEIAPQEHIATQSTGTDQLNLDQLNQLDIARRITRLEEGFRTLKLFFCVSTVPLNSLESGEWELTAPLFIAIEQRGADDFIACLYDANLFGYGESIPEALADLKVIIVNQFEYLIGQESKTEFSKALMDQFDFLKNIIVGKNA